MSSSWIHVTCPSSLCVVCIKETLHETKRAEVNENGGACIYAVPALSELSSSLHFFAFNLEHHVWPFQFDSKNSSSVLLSQYCTGFFFGVTVCDRRQPISEVKRLV